MKGGVDRGIGFVYWRLSYRRKFIRTLWLTAVSVPVLLALQVNVSIIGVVVALGIVQACYTYYRWQREIANSEDGTAAPRAQRPLMHSAAEVDRMSANQKMSPRRKWTWLVGAFALCFVAGGAIWWRGSYQDYMSGGFRWETVPLLAGVALFLSWIIGAGIVASAIAIGSAFPAIIFARVILDGMEDPTNHNLWPFEVVIAFGLGMIMTFPSAAFGWLLRRVTRRNRV